MSKKIKPRETLVEMIEATFGIRFEAKEVKKFDLSPELLDELSLNIEEYYSNYQLPEKKFGNLGHISPLGLHLAERSSQAISLTRNIMMKTADILSTLRV